MIHKGFALIKLIKDTKVRTETLITGGSGMANITLLPLGGRIKMNLYTNDISQNLIPVQMADVGKPNADVLKVQ